MGNDSSRGSSASRVAQQREERDTRTRKENAEREERRALARTTLDIQPHPNVRDCIVCKKKYWRDERDAPMKENVCEPCFDAARTEYLTSHLGANRGGNYCMQCGELSIEGWRNGLCHVCVDDKARFLIRERIKTMTNKGMAEDTPQPPVVIKFNTREEFVQQVQQIVRPEGPPCASCEPTPGTTTYATDERKGIPVDAKKEST